MIAESRREVRRRTRVRVHIDTAVYEALKLAARTRGESLDATLRRALAQYVAAHGAAAETPACS
ncbi:hypothetical protein CSC62_07425 [Pseudoxanthomonas jiangsuensis]|uniref:ribbon-helix-helix protein, CopG family n=1 Tax=Pseudoxanthomonas jiangsuensis TaxID=619688 RepID=UPI0013918425|nr:ribbon-helix-helix protein, CopG family [Pseudoxanthomonas jiangsuensis]KAF1697969.1 hypothetical protein CSC62_07425 [Pseudoxanthomonas jiangsuensis]